MLRGWGAWLYGFRLEAFGVLRFDVGGVGVGWGYALVIYRSKEAAGTWIVLLLGGLHSIILSLRSRVRSPKPETFSPNLRSLSDAVHLKPTRGTGNREPQT